MKWILGELESDKTDKVWPCIFDADGNVVVEDEEVPGTLALIVSAVNFYSSLPDDVKRLKPETVAKCVRLTRTISDFRNHAKGKMHDDWSREHQELKIANDEAMSSAVAALEEEGTP